MCQQTYAIFSRRSSLQFEYLQLQKLVQFEYANYNDFNES